MQNFIINSGNLCNGEFENYGAKNSVLPILASSIITEKLVVIENVPRITDVFNMIDILKDLGSKVMFNNRCVTLDNSSVSVNSIDYCKMTKLRASINFLGSLLYRFSECKMYYPGGCNIGTRPIDIHLKGLKDLGYSVIEKHGYIYCKLKENSGKNISLSFPSVGATENLIIAALKLKGVSVICNCAKEPEVVDLVKFLNKMGFCVLGAGESQITIIERSKTFSVTHKIIPDRIVAGTMILACAITGGKLYIKNVEKQSLDSLISKIAQDSIRLKFEGENILVEATGKLSVPNVIETAPFPNFPTDMQSQMLTFYSLTKGESVIIENIFENRFKNATELNKMGAKIKIYKNIAKIQGVDRLYGADVECFDLRSGAGLILAGLKAEGYTTLHNISFIDRGYENIESSLKSLGYDIERIEDENS